MSDEDRPAPAHRIAWWILAVLCAWFAARGWSAAVKPGAESDFRIYWNAGRAALTHGDPYAVHGFIYLPAFAVAMAPIATLPFPIACAVWQALSLLALLWASRKCVELVARDRLPTPSWLAWAPLLCVLRLADSNLGNQQVNAFVFAIVLLSASSWIADRASAAGAWAGLGAALKIVPACLVLPMIARRSWRAAVAAVVVFAASALLLPALVLGWQGNLDGLRSWSRASAGPYVEGGDALLEAREYVPGQSLTAAAYRLLAPTSATSPATARGETGMKANLVDLDPETVKWIVRALGALYLAFLVATLARTRTRGDPGVRLAEISLTIVVALTLAPLVHKAHLVWLLLPYTVLLAGPGPALPRAARIARWACILLSVLLIGATAPAFLGRALATWQLAHNAIFFGLQLVLAALAIDSWSSPRRAT